MRVIDLFAGCGGLSQGFQNVGFNIVAAFDHWKPAIRVYEKNFLNHPIIDYNLSNFSGDSSIFSCFRPDMVIGGPPCQDFSSAGKRDETGGRADLTVTFAQIVVTLEPSWFVMENVERAVGSQTYQEAFQTLKNANYGLTQVILEASLLGVPQNRKRLFLIGSLEIEDNALMPLFQQKQSKKPMTVRDYLGDTLGIEHYYRHPRSYARRGVFSIDEPSPTIRGVNRPIPPNYKPHPGDTAPITSNVRPLTFKERSLIQTFPENFTFIGNKADIEQMIGNAVPVNLAEYVGQAIMNYITSNYLSTDKQKYHQISLF